MTREEAEVEQREGRLTLEMNEAGQWTAWHKVGDTTRFTNGSTAEQAIVELPDLKPAKLTGEA